MNERIYVATRKGLFTVDRADGRWGIARTAFLGDNVSMVLPDRRRRQVLAVLEHGHFGVKVHRSHNDGETWEESTTPAYPQAPEGTADRDPGGKPIPWRLVRIWALE